MSVHDKPGSGFGQAEPCDGNFTRDAKDEVLRLTERIKRLEWDLRVQEGKLGRFRAALHALVDAE